MPNSPTHPSKQQTVIRRLGNGLIITSLLSTLIIFYPVLRSELAFRFSAQTAAPPISEAFAVTIPKIGVNSPVITNVDPFDQSAYNQALTQGVAHAAGSALPDQPGSVYLFAHSSGNPWELTYRNPDFFRLRHLEISDEITLTYHGQTYRYRVSKRLTVKPSQVGYLTGQTANQLILQTCTPIGTDWNRLLIFAEPVS